MGPNHATEFADALVIEGFPKPEQGYFPLWESIGKFREALAGSAGGGASRAESTGSWPLTTSPR